MRVFRALRGKETLDAKQEAQSGTDRQEAARRGRDARRGEDAGPSLPGVGDQRADEDEEQQLVARLHELARDRPRYGYRFMTAILRREGWRVNRKRVYRMWRQEGFQVPRKQRKKRRMGSSSGGCLRRRAARPNWTRRSSRRPSGETTEPGATTEGGCASATGLAGERASGLSGARAIPRHATLRETTGVSPLAESVWGHEVRRGQAAEGAGRREQASEEAPGRYFLRQVGFRGRCPAFEGFPARAIACEIAPTGTPRMTRCRQTSQCAARLRDAAKGRREPKPPHDTTAEAVVTC